MPLSRARHPYGNTIRPFRRPSSVSRDPQQCAEFQKYGRAALICGLVVFNAVSEGDTWLVLSIIIECVRWRCRLLRAQSCTMRRVDLSGTDVSQERPFLVVLNRVRQSHLWQTKSKHIDITKQFWELHSFPHSAVIVAIKSRISSQKLRVSSSVVLNILKEEQSTDKPM